MDEAHVQTDKEIAKIERKLRTLYERASKEAQAKADRFFKQFERIDAVKRDLLAKGKISKEEYIEWRKNKSGMFTGYYLPLVNSLAADMTNSNQIAASIVNGHLPDVYANNFNHATYQIEHDTQLDTSFTLYDRQTVERLVRDNPDVIPIKPRVDIPKDRLWNKQKINGEITQGILQGDSIPDIVKRLHKVADMNNVAAVRTARTATTAAENGGRVDSYKRAQDMGIKLRQQWLATLDGRTRDSHRALDGESIPVAKDKWHPAKFSNGCRFPGDPQGPGHEIYNCRCTLIADLVGVDQGRIDDLGIRNHRKLGSMSYDEWKEGHRKKEKPKSKPAPQPEKKAPAKMTRDYNTRMAQGMIKAIGQDEYDKALDMLEACPSEDVRNVYLYAQERTTIGDASRKGTAYHSSGAIYWNAQADAKGSTQRKPFSTHYHESGHGADYWLGHEHRRVLGATGGVTQLGYYPGGYFSQHWQNGRFGQTIVSEVKEWIDRVDGEMKAEFKAHKTDLGWLISHGYLKEFEVNALQRRARNLGLSMEDVLSGKGGTMWLPTHKKSMAYTAIENEIKGVIASEGGNFKGASLSDIVEGATKGRVQGGWGHGKSYWETQGVELEATAEMMEAYVSGPESLETLRKYLPKSVACFDEMMADAAKLIEKGRSIP